MVIVLVAMEHVQPIAQIIPPAAAVQVVPTVVLMDAKRHVATIVQLPVRLDVVEVAIHHVEENALT